MSNSTYQLKKSDSVLHDQDDWSLDALVASGDYFATLATKLDGFMQQSFENVEQPELEEVIQALLYLQHNYHLTKNK